MTKRWLFGLAMAALTLGACGDDASVDYDENGNAIVPEGTPSGVGPLDAEATYDNNATPTAVFMDECVASGTGVSTGDLVGDMTLQNCYGEDVALHNYCGRRTAVWLIGSAGWCGACEGYLPQAVANFEQRRHEGVELFVVVSEDQGYNPPTLEYCMEYAERKNLDPARVLIDNGLTTTWGNVSPTGGGGGSVGLPWQAVLDPYNMEYVWNSQTDGGDVNAVLNEMTSGL